jgi:hypothetical protein
MGRKPNPDKKRPEPRDPAMELVAANIAAAISAEGVNANRIRERMGGQNTALYDFLSGRTRSLRVDTLVKVADALGIPVAGLFEPPGIGSDQLELRDIVRMLPPAGRAALLATARSLRDNLKS